MANDETLQRLLELSGSLSTHDLQEEQRSLVHKLAASIGVDLSAHAAQNGSHTTDASPSDTADDSSAGDGKDEQLVPSKEEHTNSKTDQQNSPKEEEREERSSHEEKSSSIPKSTSDNALSDKRSPTKERLSSADKPSPKSTSQTSLFEKRSPAKDNSSTSKEASSSPSNMSSARSKFEQSIKSSTSHPVVRNTNASSPDAQVPRKANAAARNATGPSGSPSSNECDLSDSKIVDAYQQVRDDNQELNWMMMGYGDSRRVLQLYGSGTGGLQEFVSTLPNNEVVYGYVRMTYGDSGRAKFVFITYVPETLSGLAKAKANMHKSTVDQFLKYYHVHVNANSVSDLQESTVQAKLAAAAGANYGTGGVAPAGSENFGNIKSNAKTFFSETEKKGSVKAVYNKDPLSTTTPVNLTGRAGITEKYISN